MNKNRQNMQYTIYIWPYIHYRRNRQNLHTKPVCPNTFTLILSDMHTHMMLVYTTYETWGSKVLESSSHSTSICCLYTTFILTYTYGTHLHMMMITHIRRGVQRFYDSLATARLYVCIHSYR